MESSRNPAQRRLVILGLTRDLGRIEVIDLADRLGVAIETVRRDLSFLEQHGLIRRSHGTAYPLEGAGFEGPIAQHASFMVPERRRIAAAAVVQIAKVNTVYLDLGYTSRLVAEALSAISRPLTVITPSLAVAETLLAMVDSQFVVYLLGGCVRQPSLRTTGHWGMAMLETFEIDTAIMGTTGISIERGLTTPIAADTEAKALAIRQSRQKILVAIHTKFGVNSFARFARIREFDLLITNRGMSAHDARQYCRAGPDLLET